jgi:uncharacterized protein YcsI (UPF0317 family)
MLNSESTPSEARAQIRSGRWTSATSGLCAGYVQTNLVILPSDWAHDFAEFCRVNTKPLPLVEKTEVGVADRLAVAEGADLRTDLPRYRAYRHGEAEAEVGEISRLWSDDSVAFLLGCSFSAEHHLATAGVRLRHLDAGRNVPMFRTSLRCNPVGRFAGPLVVSMRAIAEEQVDRAVSVTRELPLAHGAPVHIGDPAHIGIRDLASPAWGEAMTIEPGEVPVFWACGVTPQAVIAEVRPEMSITHSPGCMFITDLPLGDP